MRPPFKRFLTLVLIGFLAICALAACTYVAHGWRLDDAIYMVVITVFGVGYGEVQEVNTPALRVVTMMLIFTSYASLILVVGGFAQMVMEGEINRALSRRRMMRGIEELSGHTILCGYGRAGRILAKELAAAKTAFAVVDQDGEKLTDAEQNGYLIVAVRRAGGVVIVDPEGDLHLRGGDTMIVLGHEGDLPQLAKPYTAKKELTYRGAKMQIGS